MGLSITGMKNSIGELQRDYLFKMEILDMPSLVLPAGCYIGIGDMIDLYMTKGVFPERKTNQIPLKWAGETYYHSGPDESNKTGELTFRLDENMKIKQFWEAAKNLTGDIANHAAHNKPAQCFKLGVGLVNVGKDTFTDYRILEDVIVYSVAGITPDKEGGGIVTFTVGISWDRSYPADGVFDTNNNKIGMSF